MSFPPVARMRPSGENARLSARPGRTVNSVRTVPEANSHKNSLLLSPCRRSVTAAIDRPSGEKARARAISFGSASSFNARISLPVLASQIRINPSLPPIATRLPSGENPSAYISSYSPIGGGNSASCFPVVTSHSVAFVGAAPPNFAAAARTFPSGERARAFAYSQFGILMLCIARPVFRFHTVAATRSPLAARTSSIVAKTSASAPKAMNRLPETSSASIPGRAYSFPDAMSITLKPRLSRASQTKSRPFGDK